MSLYREGDTIISRVDGQVAIYLYAPVDGDRVQLARGYREASQFLEEELAAEENSSNLQKEKELGHALRRAFIAQGYNIKSLFDDWSYVARVARLHIEAEE